MKFRRQQFQTAILFILVFVLGGAIGFRLQERKGEVSSKLLPIFQLKNVDQPREYKDVDFSQFWQVWGILEKDYLDPEKLDQEKMVQGAIGGMASALGDPYTVYLPPADQQRSKEDLQGSFYGVGIQLGYIENTLAVMAPLKGSPAERMGIQAGDLILHVKDATKDLDEDTTNWTLTEAVEKIRGAKGTSVTLTLYRENDDQHDQPFTVDVPREEVVVPSLEVEFVEHNGKKVAHLIISKFGERTNGELDNVISQILIERPNIAGIVVDVRNNPGGYFDTAIDIASEFIKSGVVVTQKSKTTSQDFYSKGTAKLADIPVIVVVNKGSASAAEILAGALRDQRGAKLVGEKTFGKGTVQDARELDNGAGLHVTIARWLLPKGDWIHEEGIPVSVEVKDDPNTEEDEVLMKAIDEL